MILKLQVQFFYHHSFIVTSTVIAETNSIFSNGAELTITNTGTIEATNSKAINVSNSDGVSITNNRSNKIE